MINAKNLVIEVVSGNKMDGTTNMTKPTKPTRYPTAAKIAKNHFLCNPTARNAMSHGQSQSAWKEKAIIQIIAKPHRPMRITLHF